MDVTHLEPDELEYELKLRKLRYTKRSQSISSLRAQLEKESRGHVPKPMGIPPIADLAVEKNICMEKADNLQRLVNMAITSENVEQLGWMKSRLIHFLNRLNLLSKADPSSVEEISELENVMKGKLAEVIKELAEGGAKAVVSPGRKLGSLQEFNEEGGDPIIATESIQTLEVTPTYSCTTSSSPVTRTRSVDTMYASQGPSTSTTPFSATEVGKMSSLSSTSNSKGAVPKSGGLPREAIERTGSRDFMAFPTRGSLDLPSLNSQLLQPRQGTMHRPSEYAGPQNSVPRPSHQITDVTSAMRQQPIVSILPPGQVNYSNPEFSANDYPPGNNGRYPGFSHVDASYNRPQPLPMRVSVQQPLQQFDYPNPKHQDSPPEQYGAMRRNGGNPVSNWQIRFDGSSRGMTVDDFLFRVETLARAEGVSQNQLVYAIHQLLIGRASTWYWQFCRKVPRATWYQLSYSIRREFEDQQSDYEIKMLMESRKQRPRERFCDFRLEFEGLALRMREPINQVELLQIAKRNMHPALRKTLVLRDFNNLDEMDRLCRQVEKLWSEVGETAEDQIKVRKFNVHEIEQDQYEQAGLAESRNYWGQEEEEILEVSKPNHSPYIICWNCEDLGHTFKYCPVSTGKVFCFTCGAKNVMRPNCIRCMKGNSRAGQGMRGPQNPLNPSYTPQKKLQKTDRATMTLPEMAHHAIQRKPQ